MNAVSSFRPLAQDEEWKRNQLLAKRSWEVWARAIVLFGAEDRELVSRKTVFIPSEQYPALKNMAAMASSLPGFTAILNADIVVSQDIRFLERMMQARGKVCASSRRYHFDPNTCKWDEATLGDDRGRDIFIARQDIWRRLTRVLPEDLRIGNARWDAAFVNWFRDEFGDNFIDFTDRKIVFHPVHEGRNRPYDEMIASKPDLVDPHKWI